MGVKNDYLRGLGRRQVPGDTHHRLRIFPDYSEETSKHIQVPTWVLNYD